jgi:hypothetical protein
VHSRLFRKVCSPRRAKTRDSDSWDVRWLL